jgi:DNA-binding transcriptional regulator LsrR (DeoR family)
MEMTEDPTIVQEPSSAGARGRRARRRRPAGAGDSALTTGELQGLICHYFCVHGLMPSQIKDRLASEHGVHVSREEAYRQIGIAARRKLIRFLPPPEDDLRRRLEERYAWLQGVDVVETSVYHGVAESGAATLLALLKRHYRGREVHIGFSGGSALRILSHRFAELLREPDPNLPTKVVFHALVAGFDVRNPTTDPNSFFSYFAGDMVLAVETAFYAFYVPPVADEGLRKEIRAQKGVEEAYEHRDEIDVVVTSASSWKDGHSILRKYIRDSQGSPEELERAGCVGDMLWQPVSRSGAIEHKTPISANTLMDLEEVGALVARGKHVLLVAGPCTQCHTPKSDIVQAILTQPTRLVTHLVVDSRCARTVLGER